MAEAQTQITDESSGASLKFVPPYGTPWDSFIRLIDKMSTEGVPQRIDRSYLSNQSGNVQTYLMQAFRSFQLTNEGGFPEKLLHKLASASAEERPGVMAEIIGVHYGPIVAMGQTNATQGQLEEEWGKSFNQKGDTQRKAVRFFLAACSYAQLPVSKLWKAPRASSPRGPRKPRAVTSKASTQEQGNSGGKGGAATKNSPQGDSYQVTLQGGGTVTVIVAESHFNLSKHRKDRDFVFGLVDSMTDYASANGQDVVSADHSPSDEDDEP